MRTGLNVRHADEQLRGTIALPHGLGKEVKVAVFARGDKAREAEEAGADFVGAEDLAQRVQEEGFTDFDVAIATPGHDAGGRPPRPHPRPAGQDAEPEGRHGHAGRAQGRRGVQGRQGRVPHRPHRDRPPHGRQDVLRRQALLENYQAIIEELIRAKPSAAKGKYIRSIVMASTHGPGVKVDPSQTRTCEAEAAEAAPRRRFDTASPRDPRQPVSPGQEEHGPRTEGRRHRERGR